MNLALSRVIFQIMRLRGISGKVALILGALRIDHTRHVVNGCKNGSYSTAFTVLPRLTRVSSVK